MAKRYTLLQNKLEELESELNKVMTLPVDYHQLLSEGINGKVTFLKSLISAEFQSHPQNPHHLNHIAQRFKELESAFNDWDSFGTLFVDHIDSASTCSCTDSCFNDDEIQIEFEDGGGGSSDLDVHHYQDPSGIDMEGVIQEQQQPLPLPLPPPPPPPTAVATDKAEEFGEKEERKHWSRNKVSAGMSGVVMLTVAVMGVVMASFCGSYKMGSDGFVVPPT